MVLALREQCVHNVVSGCAGPVMLPPKRNVPDGGLSSAWDMHMQVSRPSISIKSFY